jgi:nucleotide-binding universal stress UspA family protein
LDHAVAIAKWYGSRLAALHVIRSHFTLEQPTLDSHRSSSGTRDAVEPFLRDQLNAWLSPAKAAGVTTDGLFDEGNAARRILERATSLGADLMILGTHGRGGIERFVLGSVTEKVVRKAACPVLTVPPPTLTAAKLPYKRLLCPVDFSTSSLAALRFALSIAKESDAHVTVLHVLDWPPEGELIVERFDTAEFRRVVEEQTRAQLEGLISDEARTWSNPETQVAYGKPYRQILELAEREQPDLIVMGVRGRNPIDLALFGSTASHVVRRASCPVLTLRRS